ncbi:MAG: serine/threonine-protein kinase, partial [Roseimicrobium sp.]
MEQERYQILERLGMGGIGVVYKGFDRQLNRHVAIKRLMNRNEFADSSAEESALHKEASTLAAMRHPSIVTIFDVSSDEDGVFMVMELLEGDDLGHYLYREGPLPLADFEQLATQMLEALIAAHDMKLLHRDIKTENIRVQRALTGRFQCKLVDFGLARVSHVAMKQTVDQSGNVLGSVSYMAPEQFIRE